MLLPEDEHSGTLMAMIPRRSADFAAGTMFACPILVNSLIQDVRFAFRMLLRMRGLAIVATLTLGIGIAATTTMFSVAYAVLLRPLPFERPNELAMLYVTLTTPRDGTRRVRWSFAESQKLPSAAGSFESLGTFTTATLNLTGTGDAEQLDGEVASPGYFQVLRVAAARGRTFGTDDERSAVALISDGLWRRRFGSDPAIVGRSIGLNDVPLTILGVLPERFAGLSGRAQVWLPPAMAAQLIYRGYLTTPQHFINVVGRLRRGTTVAHADAELGAIARRIVTAEESAGPAATWSATVWSLAAAHVDAAAGRLVLVLLAAVGCVLLITCVNIASLLLARGSSRRREIAVRLAIGSGRWRVIRQLLTESVVLALVGGGVAMILTMWAVDLIAGPVTIASPGNGYLQLGAFAKPTLDVTVMVFALGATFVTGIVFGLMPALEISRANLANALKEDTRSGSGRHHRVLSALVVSELALAVLLLAVAGLLIRSFAQMQDLRTGFVPDGVVAFLVAPPASRYEPADGPAIVERLLTAVEHVPGVAAAAVNRCAPFDTRCARTTVFFPERPTPMAAAPTVGRHYVSAGYFRALGIPLRAGRGLRDDDREGRPPVAVVNETAARRFWPDENPIGKRVWFGPGTGFTGAARPLEIVGVVGDVKYGGVDDPVLPDFYTSYRQFTYPDTMIIVKTAQPMGSIVPALRAAVAGVDPGLPVYDVRTLDDRVDAALSRPRLAATVIGAFALSALLLAAIGVYGVMAYAVTSRRREIGIRVALGADRGDVVALVLGQGARLTAAGVAIGLAVSVAAARVIRTLLFGIAPTDPAVFGLTVMVIIGVALAAALVPARRASTIDPMTVLRTE
jgi:putative ABC transport system permease protein